MGETTLSNPTAARANRRETMLLIGAAAVLLTALAAITMLGLYASPASPHIAIGTVAQFPAGTPPRLVTAEAVKFWVVNIDGEIVVFDARTTHGFRCSIKWVQVYDQFEDWCSGSKFKIDGTWISGPAPRNLDRYPVSVSADGTVWLVSYLTIKGDTHP